VQHHRRAARGRLLEFVRAVAGGVERQACGERAGGIAVDLARIGRGCGIYLLLQLGEEPFLLRLVFGKRARCPGAGLELAAEPNGVPG